MRKLALFLTILTALIGCSKDNPTETPTPTPDITFTGKIVGSCGLWYGGTSLSSISISYFALFDTAYTIESVLSAKTDTFVAYVYLSNNKAFLKSAWLDASGELNDSTWIGAYLTIICNDEPKDTSTTIDSLVVYYSYWRNAVRYGPYKNKHRNPPTIKYDYPYK